MGLVCLGGPSAGSSTTPGFTGDGSRIVSPGCRLPLQLWATRNHTRDEYFDGYWKVEVDWIGFGGTENEKLCRGKKQFPIWSMCGGAASHFMARLLCLYRAVKCLLLIVKLLGCLLWVGWLNGPGGCAATSQTSAKVLTFGTWMAQLLYIVSLWPMTQAKFDIVTKSPVWTGSCLIS